MSQNEPSKISAFESEINRLNHIMDTTTPSYMSIATDHKDLANMAYEVMTTCGMSDDLLAKYSATNKRLLGVFAKGNQSNERASSL